MGDVEQRFYDLAVEALEEQRHAYRRYIEIVDAQRAALQSDNIKLVTSLAGRLDGIIEEIRQSGKRLTPAYEAIGAAALDGPRIQTIKDIMTAAAAEAATAQAAVRDLTRRLVGDREQLGIKLGLAPHPSTTREPKSGSSPPPSALIDSLG